MFIWSVRNLNDPWTELVVMIVRQNEGGYLVQTGRKALNLAKQKAQIGGKWSTKPEK